MCVRVLYANNFPFHQKLKSKCHGAWFYNWKRERASFVVMGNCTPESSSYHLSLSASPSVCLSLSVKSLSIIRFHFILLCSGFVSSLLYRFSIFHWISTLLLVAQLLWTGEIKTRALRSDKSFDWLCIRFICQIMDLIHLIQRNSFHPQSIS